MTETEAKKLFRHKHQDVICIFLAEMEKEETVDFLPFKHTGQSLPRKYFYLEVTGEDRDPLNLIFHLPKTEKGRQELQKQVAAVHVEAISLLLQKVAYSQEQKERLLRGLDAYLKE